MTNVKKKKKSKAKGKSAATFYTLPHYSLQSSTGGNNSRSDDDLHAPQNVPAHHPYSNQSRVCLLQPENPKVSGHIKATLLEEHEEGDARDNRRRRVAAGERREARHASRIILA